MKEKDDLRIVIIGLGGIGTVFVNTISRFLEYSRVYKQVDIHLVDGDSYEVKNYERQEFNHLGNKARIKANELKKKFPAKIQYSVFTEYLNADNISAHIEEKDVVCLCVDNHKTRKIVSDYCRTLDNITILSGGNDWTDGTVQIYIRKDGKDLSAPITKYHPEIDNPDDRSPEEMSCEELSKVDPQLFFTNTTAAILMCCAFWNVVVNDEVDGGDVYFDIELMAVTFKPRAA